MSAQQTLFLSKRSVFGVLGLAFILVLVSSLLTFASSRKLAGTLDELEQNQHLTAKLEILPVQFELLLHNARVYARTGSTIDLTHLQQSLNEWLMWDSRERSLIQEAGARQGLADIKELVTHVTTQLSIMVDLGQSGSRSTAISIAMKLEDQMPNQKLHQLTTKVSRLVRADYYQHAKEGQEDAENYQHYGMAFVGSAITLGLLASILLSRRMRELESFITVCAWTKRVKYEGHWVPFEEFLEKRFQLKLSHGISEEAAQLELEQISDKKAPTGSEG